MVFRVLLTHWDDFCIFRKDLSDDKLDLELEKQLHQARLERQRARREENARKSRDDARRRSSELFDPFADEFDRAAEKQASVSWSYSQHVANSFEREQVLNMADENTFASLQNVGSIPSAAKVPKIQSRKSSIMSR